MTKKWKRLPSTYKYTSWFKQNLTGIAHYEFVDLERFEGKRRVFQYYIVRKIVNNKVVSKEVFANYKEAKNFASELMR